MLPFKLLRLYSGEIIMRWTGDNGDQATSERQLVM